MSALKSAHELPKEGEMLASIPGSAVLARAKKLLLMGGGACTALFMILAMVLPGAQEKGGHDDHDHDKSAAAVSSGHGEEVLTADQEAGHDGEAAEDIHWNWKGGMAYSWLFGVVFFLTLCVGGIFWTLLHNASNSGWGVLVRRLMENLGSVVVLMFVLALPLIVFPAFRDALWEWLPKQAEIREQAEHHVTDNDSALVKEAMAEYAAGAEEARANLATVKAEVEPLLADASPGKKFHLEERIAVAQELVAEAEAEAGDHADADAVEAHLIDHHIKEADVLLYKKGGYLNKGFWLFRYVMIAVALTGIIYLLRTWSIQQDAAGEAKFTLLSRRWSCGLLPVFAVSWTFLVFDWLMALDYTWFSTMWGVYLFAGCALSSMALLILLLTQLRERGAFKNLITMEHYHIMGKLMHAFVIFWAYIAFSQFFLIWYANITEETRFYLARNTDYWNAYTIAFLVIGHFFVPFGALLLQSVKKTPRLVCIVCFWVLAMHIFDVYWIIIPERGPSLTDGAAMSFPMVGSVCLDILAWLAVAGLAGAFFLHRLGQASLYPSRDPRLDESLNLVN